MKWRLFSVSQSPTKSFLPISLSFRFYVMILSVLCSSLSPHYLNFLSFDHRTLLQDVTILITHLPTYPLYFLISNLPLPVPEYELDHDFSLCLLFNESPHTSQTAINPCYILPSTVILYHGNCYQEK
jgi:hypothetical protein